MVPLTVYTSNPIDPGLAGFVLALGYNLGHSVRLLPLAALPAPDPQRRQALRVERLELVEAIAQTQHELERFGFGDARADAGRESGLRYDLDALRSRLRGVETVLGTQKGGPDNA